MPYVEDVIKAFAARPERMGAFPMPTTACTTAAEILKSYLASMKAACAVNVIELNVNNKPQFLVANSSNPSLIHEFMTGTREGEKSNKLVQANGDLAKRVGAGSEFRIVNTGFDFYEPGHDGVIKLFKAVKPGFDGETSLIDVASTTEAIADFRQALWANPQTTYDTTSKQKADKAIVGKWSDVAKKVQESNSKALETKQIDKNYATKRAFKGEQAHSIQGAQASLTVNPGTQLQNALARVLTCAVALRFRMTDPARDLVRTELGYFENAVTRGKPEILVKQRRPVVDAVLTHVNALQKYDPGVIPVKPAHSTTFEPLDAVIERVWEEVFRSRFCAEPRAFGFLKSRKFADSQGNAFPRFTITSQTCFWVCGTEDKRPNPLEYQVIGPESRPGDGSITGSYMWPCSSCKNRSKWMLSGLDTGGARRPHEV